MTPGQASLFDSLLSLARPEDDKDLSPRATQAGLYYDSQYDGSDTLGGHNRADVEVLHNAQEVGAKLCASLVLDRQVKSNALPFVLQSYALWMVQFLFEPVRMIPCARAFILGEYSRGPAARWRMMTISNAIRAITGSTGYTLEAFETLVPHMYQELTRVPSFGKDRATDQFEALQAMSTTYEFISTTLKVYPLSKGIRAMQVVAPVFRRGCLEPEDRPVNLPNLLSDTNLPLLRYFAMMDVLVSVVINRPMNFRYDTTFDPEVASAFEPENGWNMCWLYGVPDRLIIIFARMNALLEDFGPGVDPRVIKGLEAEINEVKSVTVASADSSLAFGRLVVQECWRQVAYIYLYMGLCGADSLDARVIRAHGEFMNMLIRTKPGRIPDSFLVLPLPVLGIAAYHRHDQEFLKRRMLALPECARKGTSGNEFIRMLECMWGLVDHSGKPLTWFHLRLASLYVTGV
ncbi:fungal zn(2)-cys(6) binuclear cluster domain protein, putative, partial [Rhizoctonia solani AG-3 Rhs1AP]